MRHALRQLTHAIRPPSRIKAIRGLTPDEMYFGTAASDASELPSRLAAARAARLLANRAVSCPVCPARPGSGDPPVPA